MSHICHRYEICHEGYLDDYTRRACGAQLVVRRGQEVKVVLCLDSDYDPCYEFRVVSQLGK